MYNPEVLKQEDVNKEIKIKELLSKKEISLDVSELIRNNDYILKALEGISRKLNNYQLDHVLNTAERARLVAEERLNDDQLKLLLKAALIHDVGKAEDDDISEIVREGKNFSEKEREKMQEHVGLMVNWCKKNNVPGEVVAVAARHHEKSGDENSNNGYRRNINGENDYLEKEGQERREKNLNNQSIDRLGNILRVVDVYDSLRSQRAYKSPLEPKICREEMIKIEILTQKKIKKY